MAEMGSLEFVSLSPASSIRQRVRYSIGDSPTVCLNLRAKVDRDMPARSASFCSGPRSVPRCCQDRDTIALPARLLASSLSPLFLVPHSLVPVLPHSPQI